MFTHYSMSILRVLDHAEMLAKKIGDSKIAPEHILFGYLVEQNSLAGELVLSYGLDPKLFLDSMRIVHQKRGIVNSLNVHNQPILTRFQFAIVSIWSERTNLFLSGNRVRPYTLKFTPMTIRIFKKSFYYANRRKDIVIPELLLGVLFSRAEGISDLIFQITDYNRAKVLFRLNKLLPELRIRSKCLYFGSEADFMYRIPTESNFKENFTWLARPIYRQFKQPEMTLSKIYDVESYTDYFSFFYNSKSENYSKTYFGQEFKSFGKSLVSFSQYPKYIKEAQLVFSNSLKSLMSITFLSAKNKKVQSSFQNRLIVGSNWSQKVK